jgi:PAS domain S-box-containing protein
MVPIISKQRSMGFLAVGSKKLHKFTKREVRLLLAFSSQLGGALQNAQLYDEVTRDKAYIENLVENAGDAIISTDREDRILTWNGGAEVIFGYSKEQTVGQSLAIMLPEPHSKELEEIRNQVRLTGVIRNLEVRRTRSDGRTIEVSLAVSPIRDTDENVIGYLHLARDVTEKKRYEQRLKELDKMKSAFVSNVSHELRTPLTAIKASVDNMLDRPAGASHQQSAGSFNHRGRKNRSATDKPSSGHSGGRGRRNSEAGGGGEVDQSGHCRRGPWGGCLGRSRQSNAGAHKLDR